MRNILLVAMILFSISCDKEEPSYIIIKDANAKEIEGDTISVALNSVHQLLIEVGSHGGSPRYLRQVDEGAIINLYETDDYELLSQGGGAIFIEKVVLTTAFVDTLMSQGSIVEITARVSTDISKSMYYKVN